MHSKVDICSPKLVNLKGFVFSYGFACMLISFNKSPSQMYPLCSIQCYFFLYFFLPVTWQPCPPRKEFFDVFISKENCRNEYCTVMWKIQAIIIGGYYIGNSSIYLENITYLYCTASRCNLTHLRFLKC
jgi:hypothetical protein